MKWKKWLGGFFCLFLLTGMLQGIPAQADAVVEDWWLYSYSVDRFVYVNPADQLGLFMRFGPGTEYAKVNSQTIPMYTRIHVTQECTGKNGWKWGYCSYQFPGRDSADSGWVCLVETTTKNPAPAAAESPSPTLAATEQPSSSVAPVTTDPPETKTPVQSAAPLETETPASAEVQQTPDAEADQPSEARSGAREIYTTAGLVLVGIVVGAVAATALFLLARKKK